MIRPVLALAVLLSHAPVLAGGSWQYFTSTDPFTDQVYAAAAARSKDGTGKIMIRCTDFQKLDILIHFGAPLGLGPDNPTPLIRYRVDANPAMESMGIISADFRAVFVAKDVEKLAMLVGLLAGSKFLIETQDATGRRHLKQFDLKGSTPPIRRVVDRCQGEQYPKSLMQAPGG